MDILEKLNWRYATKVFDSSKKIPEDQFNRLLESLRLSASSFGLQPWKFVVVENTELRAQLLEHSWKQPQVVDASHLLVFCRPEDTTTEDVDRFVESIAQTRDVPVESLEGYAGMMKGFVSAMDADKKATWMKDQIYIALGSFLVTCAVEGIDACPMEGFSAPDYDRILDLPAKGLRSCVVCPVGHRSADDKYASLAKVRYALDDVIVRI